MLIGMAVSVGGAAIAGIAVVTLMGAAYAPAVGVTTALMVASGFIVVSLSLGYTAVALGHERLTGASPRGRPANIAANLVLIPLFGMYAAAATTLVTELTPHDHLGASASAEKAWRTRSRWSWCDRAVLAGASLFVAVRVSLAVGGGLWVVRDRGVAVFVAGVPSAAGVARGLARAVRRGSEG